MIATAFPVGFFASKLWIIVAVLPVFEEKSPVLDVTAKGKVVVVLELNEPDIPADKFEIDKGSVTQALEDDKLLTESGEEIPEFF